MKFIVSSKALLSRLVLLKNAVNTSTVLPILETVLFVVQENKVMLYTTDLKQVISLQLDCEHKPGSASFCVGFKQIFDLASNCLEQPITIAFDSAKETLNIIGDNFEVSLITEPAANYPKLPVVKLNDQDSIKVSGKQKDDLFMQLRRAIPFASRDDLRPAMTGIYLHSVEGKLNVVSTDAHRLYFKATDINYIGKPMIVEVKAIKSLLLLFSKSDEILLQSDEINLRVTDSFRYTEMFTRLIDARYPDYASVLENALSVMQGSVSMIAKDMKRTIKFCSAFTNRSTSQLVFEIDKLHIRYKAEDRDFQTSATVSSPVYDADLSEPLTIAMNANFILEILNIFKDDYIKLGLPSSPLKAIIINDCALLMPLMLNN